jgi:hypothetical protein
MGKNMSQRIQQENDEKKPKTEEHRGIGGI